MSVVNISVDECVDRERAQDYIDVLNAVVHRCVTFGYVQGSRNTIAVNLTVCAYMLGLDAIAMLDRFMSLHLIKVWEDDERPHDRVWRILDYVPSFSWDWMIDADDYRIEGEILRNEGHDNMPIWYQLCESQPKGEEDREQAAFSL